jgi:alpha/beta superfamily hydrolase
MTYELIRERERKIVEIGHSFVWFSKDKRKKEKKSGTRHFFHSLHP